MKNLFISIVCGISLLFFFLSYKYFHFGSDFFYKSNFLVGVLLVCIYVLGFFLGRFFPYEDQEDVETALLPNQELEVETPISTQKKNVKVEKVDFHDIQGVTSPQGKKDNLQLLEGIGPKIQDLLYAHEVYSFEQLASCSTQELNDILDKGGDRFTLCNPSTWPYQAQLASEKNWGKLKEYQDFLMRGVES